MYKLLIRPFFFLFNPESIHNISFSLIKFICNIPFLKEIIKSLFSFDNKKLEYNLFNLKFKNRIGLAAGFDKNAEILNEIELFGFGHVEVGTITPKPQSGNPSPRLFRLQSNEALINRMGFNNEGVDKILERLKSYKGSMIIGANIGKNKNTPNEEAINDYLHCFIKLRNFVNYFVINVSSPNTPNLRDLQEKSKISAILKSIQSENKKEKLVPVLLKISPDLSKDQVRDIVEVCLSNKIDGIIVTNTTISRDNLKKIDTVNASEEGGLSGRPLKNKSDNMIKYIKSISDGKIKIIGVGGVFNFIDFKDKVNAGADMVQVYTGWIYEGPSMVKRIVKSILKS